MKAGSEYETKVEYAPDMHVVKVTWWNGKQWWSTHEVRPGAKPKEA